jgi:hypothetical protein
MLRFNDLLPLILNAMMRMFIVCLENISVINNEKS